jgi:plasmid stabilization system protein ParE
MNRAAEHPLMYRRTDYRGRPRRINVFEYAIFYEPFPEGDGIRVRRVIHGRRNIARLIRSTD